MATLGPRPMSPARFPLPTPGRPTRAPLRAALLGAALAAACAVEPEGLPAESGRRSDAIGGPVEPQGPYDFAWLPAGPVTLEVALAPLANAPVSGSTLDVLLERDPPRPGEEAVSVAGAFLPALRRGSASADVDAGTWLWSAQLVDPNFSPQTLWSPPASFTVDPNVPVPGWLQTSPRQFEKGEHVRTTPYRVPGEVGLGFFEPAPGMPAFDVPTVFAPDSGWAPKVTSTYGQLVGVGGGPLLFEQFGAGGFNRVELVAPVRFPQTGRVSLGLATANPAARIWVMGPAPTGSATRAPLIGVAVLNGQLAWASSASDGRWNPVPGVWPTWYDAGAPYGPAVAPMDAGVLTIEYDSVAGSFDLWMDRVPLARDLVYGEDAGSRVPVGLVLGHTAERDPYGPSGSTGQTRLWDLEVMGPSARGAYHSPPLELSKRPPGAQRLGWLTWTEEERGGAAGRVTLSIQHSGPNDPWHDLWNLEAGGDPGDSSPVRFDTPGVDLSGIDLEGPYQLRLVAYFDRPAGAWPGPALKEWSFTWKGTRLEAVPPERFRAQPGAQAVLSARVVNWDGQPIPGVPVRFEVTGGPGKLVTPNPHLTNPRGLAQATVQLGAAPAKHGIKASAPVFESAEAWYEVDTRTPPAGALGLNPDAAPETNLGCNLAWRYDARGAQDASWRWYAAVAPEGFVIDEATGVATWTPRPDQVGAHAVVLRVVTLDWDYLDVPLELQVSCANDLTLQTTCGCGAGGALGGAAWLWVLALWRRRRLSARGAP